MYSLGIYPAYPRKLFNLSVLKFHHPNILRQFKLVYYSLFISHLNFNSIFIQEHNKKEYTHEIDWNLSIFEKCYRIQVEDQFGKMSEYSQDEKCVKTGNYRKSRKLYLKRNYASKASYNQYINTSTETIIENEGITLSCNYYFLVGDQMITNVNRSILWYKDSKEIIDGVSKSGQLLTIKKLNKRKHDGIYECKTAFNHYNIFIANYTLYVYPGLFVYFYIKKLFHANEITICSKLNEN